MPGVLALLLSKTGLALIAVALVVAVIGVQSARLSHAKSDLARIAAAQKLAQADVKTHEATAAGISVQAAQGLSEAHAGVVVKYRTLIQRIPVDVPEGADRDCVLPKGWVSLWNAGAEAVQP